MEDMLAYQKIALAAPATRLRAWVPYIPIALGLAVCAALLLGFPLSKPIWTDEHENMMEALKPYGLILTGNASATQPPLHLLIMHLCLSLFGRRLDVLRTVSALPVVGAVWYAYLLGRRFSNQAGLVALWLAALSPALVLFGRMARYHGLLTLCATMSVYYALVLLKSGERKHMTAYVISTFLMLMTYYLSIFVLVAQVAALLYRWKQEPNRMRMIMAMAIAVAVFLPWFTHALLHAPTYTHARPVEEHAISLGVGGFVRRSALPAYAFCVGETVYPWTWGISLTGIACCAIGFGLGARKAWSRPEITVVATCVLVLLLSAAATSGKLGIDQTIGSMGKRLSFVLPLFYVLLGAGLCSIRRPAVRIGLTATLLLVSLYSLRNYWLDREFLNPAYVARWDETIGAMQHVRLDSDTLVLSYSEVALDYYLDKLPTPVRHDCAKSPRAEMKELAASPPRYLWLVGRDRGDRRSVQDLAQLTRELSKRYRLVGHFVVMPRSPDEQYWSKLVLRRNMTPFYIWGDLFDTAAPVPPSRVASQRSTVP